MPDTRHAAPTGIVSCRAVSTDGRHVIAIAYLLFA